MKQITDRDYFDVFDFPNCNSGHNYALDVVEGRVLACKYVIGACNRYLRDLENTQAGYYFDKDIAERYLRLVQQFEHVIGNWPTKNIVYDPWQNFCWMNIMGFINKETKYRRFRVAHVEIPRGQGKAHPLDQVVPTPHGMRLWKDIEIGSELYSRDGTICRVTGKTKIENFDEYVVKFSDGSEVSCSSGHLWITQDVRQKDNYAYHVKKYVGRVNKSGEVVSKLDFESTKSTLDIMDSLRANKQINHRVFNSKKTESSSTFFKGLDPYFVGYWLGNGYKGGTRVSCHIDDYKDLADIFIQRGMDFDKGPDKGNGAIINFRGILVNMREAGLIGNKKIGADWHTFHSQDRMAIIRGLMDSDGHIDKNGSCYFYSSNWSIVSGIRRLLASLGVKSSLREKRIHGSNNYRTDRQHYVVSFTPNFVPFMLKRKADRFVFKDTHYADKRYIVDVVKTGIQKEMFCVEVDSKDHSYLIGNEFIPTHNSAMASQACLYFLALEKSEGNQISTVATRREQARIVLDSARAMAEKAKSYVQQTGVKVRAHDVVHKQSNSKLRALSSDHTGLDGLNDVLAVCDELHAMSRDTFDVITSGMSKRRDSLTLCITTAGFDTESVGFSQSEYAKKVCMGETLDEQFFGVVYTIDDGDDIYDEATWRKANPSYGASVDPVTFAAKAKKAKEVPADVPNFKVKHLNIWLSEAHAFYSQAKWDLCQSPVPISIEQFRGKSCMVGIDKASHLDLSSIVYLFKEGDKYYWFDKTYIPEQTVRNANNDIYAKAIESGHLIKTPGETIDQDMLRKVVSADSRMFRIQKGAYDPWNAIELGQALTKERINMLEFRMNVQNLSEATKRLDVLIRNGKIVHNGSPLLRWCLGNVVCKVDHVDNVFPRKTHEKLKIDPIIAGIMALALYIQDERQESVYNTRPVRII